MAKNQKPARRDREKEKLRAENSDLRRKLAETEQHRHLLIQTLHAVAGTSPQTLTKLRTIISSYGMVPNPTNATIVGPAVPSMGQFTLDVNKQFSRSYVNSVLQAAWDVNQTGYYIDNNP
jgi:hypothetical protein